MPFMFGAGVNGLFSGMSDALKIYQMYQGAMDGQAQRDAAGKIAEAQQADQDWGGVEDTVGKLRKEYGDQQPPQSDQQSAPAAGDKPAPTKLSGGASVTKINLDDVGKPPADAAPAGRDAAPETRAPSGGATTGDQPLGTPAAAASMDPDAAPPDKPKPERGKEQYDRVAKALGGAADWAKAHMPTSVDPDAPAYTPPAPSPPSTPGVAPPTPPAQAPNPVGPYTGAIPVRSPELQKLMDQQTPGAPPQPTPPDPRAPNYDPSSQSGFRARRGGNVMQRGAPPYAQAPPTLAGQPAPGQPAPGQPPAAALSPAATPPDPRAPNYDPTDQSGFRARRGGNVMQRGQPPYAPTPAPAQGGGPPASLGARLLSAINPISSAQAAEPTAAPGGAAPAGGVASPSPSPQPQPGQSGTPAAAAGAPTSTPTAALKPAARDEGAAPAATTAPAKDAPPPAQTGPTQSAAPVAPDQKGKTEQSEAPTVRVPTFDHRPYHWLEKHQPDNFELINKIAHEEGADPAQVALHWYIESRFGTTSVDSSEGARGPLQILPTTAKMVDPKGEFDITTLPGGLRVAARYIHMELDPRFGPGTPSNIAAYLAGPQNADRIAGMSYAEAQRAYPRTTRALAEAFPGSSLAQSHFTPGHSVDPHELINRGNAEGPDGFLRALVSTGPQGMTMSNLWRQAENAVVYAAMRRGDYQGAMAGRDFVFQMSHQGAVSNMMAADQALLAGNATSAAQYLAKAHAFFPDGTFGRFGVDGKGNLWGEQFDENSGKSAGKPFQITHDALAFQLAQTQDPHKYLQFVQEQQKTNSAMRLANAHADYYSSLPDFKQQQAALKWQNDEANRRSKEAIAGGHDDTRTATTEANNRARMEIAAAKADTTAKHEIEVGKEASTLYTENGDHAVQGIEPGDYGRHGEIYTAIRMSPQPHGGFISSPLAQTMAKGIASGQLSVRKSNDGSVYGVVDKQTGAVRGYLSTEQGDRIRNLPGSNLISPPTPGGASGGTQRQAAVGAGAGSQTAMMNGMNQNLTGQPLRALG